MEELIKCFEPFDLSGKKNHQSNKKKDDKSVQFKIENSKNTFFCKNHGRDPTYKTKQFKLELNKRNCYNRDNRDNRHDRDRR